MLISTHHCTRHTLPSVQCKCVCVWGGGGGGGSTNIYNYAITCPQALRYNINAVQVCGEKSMFKKERERERGGGGSCNYKLKERNQICYILIASYM